MEVQNGTVFVNSRPLSEGLTFPRSTATTPSCPRCAFGRPVFCPRRSPEVVQRQPGMGNGASPVHIRQGCVRLLAARQDGRAALASAGGFHDLVRNVARGDELSIHIQSEGGRSGSRNARGGCTTRRTSRARRCSARRSQIARPPEAFQSFRLCRSRHRRLSWQQHESERTELVQVHPGPLGVIVVGNDRTLQSKIRRASVKVPYHLARRLPPEER